jgi:predicted dinucleotide-binding enzyme
MKGQGTMKHSRRAFLRAAGAVASGTALGSLPFAVRAASAAAEKLKIGIIGSGRIGGTLGGIWVKSGHEVMFSSLDLEQDKALAAKLGGGARAGTTREAVAFGDVLLLAVPYRAFPDLSKEVGPAMKGKVVIDVSNPIVARDGEVAAQAREKGAGLAAAEYFPGARIVRAFNAIGYAKLPEFADRPGERTGMPMAADDQKAYAVAADLVREVGLEPVLVGPLAMGKHLIPGTPLAGEHTPEQIRQIAATLK